MSSILDIKKAIWGLLHLKLEKYIKTLAYRKRLPVLLDRISSKDRVRIIFFLPNLSMWKYELLFKFLLQDSYFEPIIIPFPHPWNSKDEQLEFFHEICDYCKKNKFPFINGYDVEYEVAMDAKDLHPDIIVYTQPYNTGYEFWKIEKFWKKSIFVYSSYGAPIDSDTIFHFSLLQNICWKLFYPTTSLKYIFRQNLLTQGCNLSFVGDPMFDLFNNQSYIPSYSDWKSDDPKYKRIIWAPHHSILEEDYLHNSNFLELAEPMLRLAEERVDSIQFAFKPHPYLKEKLCKLWGVYRTEEYYRRWTEMPNTTYISGAYIDLFLTSDALVHDCESFMCEYLYTQKPALYILNNRATYKLNKLGQGCLDMHYKGHNINDVISFIDNVIVKGNDTSKGKRERFYNEFLRPQYGNSVGENIYDELCELKKMHHGSNNK